MSTITTHFGISRVPFMDVELDQDNRVYLDPHLIRTSTIEPYRSLALHSIDSFVDVVARAATSSSLVQREHGRQVLCAFSEPWETRLGMSAVGYRGHGGGMDVGEAIWASMTTDAQTLLIAGRLRQLEYLPLVVPGLGDDITSDMTTRIVFGALAAYTADMIAQFPELTMDRTITVERPVWDSVRKDWAVSAVTLPTPQGQALLLVPAAWVAPSITMRARRFYNTTILDVVQQEQTVVVNGKVLRPHKKDLKKQPALSSIRPTNVTVALRASDRGEDVFERFRQFVISKAA